MRADVPPDCCTTAVIYVHTWHSPIPFDIALSCATGFLKGVFWIRVGFPMFSGNSVCCEHARPTRHGKGFIRTSYFEQNMLNTAIKHVCML